MRQNEIDELIGDIREIIDLKDHTTYLEIVGILDIIKSDYMDEFRYVDDE